MLDPPEKAPEVPAGGFQKVKDVYVPPSEVPDLVAIAIPGDSSRLQKLEPFPKWDGKDFDELPVILKAKGK